MDKSTVYLSVTSYLNLSQTFVIIFEARMDGSFQVYMLYLSVLDQLILFWHLSERINPQKYQFIIFMKPLNPLKIEVAVLNLFILM